MEASHVPLTQETAFPVPYGTDDFQTFILKLCLLNSLAAIAFSYCLGWHQGQKKDHVWGKI